MDNVLLYIISNLAEISSAISRNDVNISKFEDKLPNLKRQIRSLIISDDPSYQFPDRLISKNWESAEDYLIDCYRYFGKIEVVKGKARFIGWKDMYHSLLLLEDKVLCLSLEKENLQ